MVKLAILCSIVIFLSGCSAARPVIRNDEDPVRTTAESTSVAEDFHAKVQEESTATRKEPQPALTGPEHTVTGTQAVDTDSDIKSASDNKLVMEDTPETTRESTQGQSDSSSNTSQAGGQTSQGTPESEVSQNKVSKYNLFDYYPLIPNRGYTLKGAEGGGSSSVLQYFHEEPGSATAQIKQFNDSAVLVKVLRLTTDEVTELYYSQSMPYRHSIMGHTDYEERVIIKAPLEMGNKWTSTGLDFEITALDEERIINGTNMTVMDVTVSTGGEQVLFTYAMGIGLVSNDVINPDGSLTNIVHFESLAEDIRDSYDVRFYFPSEEGLVSYLRPVEFATNDSTRQKLAAKYKLIAEEEGFTPVLGPEAQLQYIYIEGGTIHLDLNQAFVDFINEEPELEDIRIQALVDTLAGYHRMNFVRITVNDQRYESLNRKIEPNELLTPTPPEDPNLPD